MLGIKIFPQRLQSQDLLQITAQSQIHLTATRLDLFFSKTKLIKIRTGQVAMQQKAIHPKNLANWQLFAKT